MVELTDNETGEVMTEEQIAFAYTREGRRIIGKEYPNPIPMEPPLGYVPSKPLHEQIREMVLREQAIASEEDETFEEADDFEVGDDYDPTSPWEEQFEPTDPFPATSEVTRLEREIAEARNRARLDAIRADVEDVRAGRTPRSEAPPPEPPLERPTELSGKPQRGGGGAEPPGGKQTGGL